MNLVQTAQAHQDVIDLLVRTNLERAQREDPEGFRAMMENFQRALIDFRQIMTAPDDANPPDGSE